MENLKLQYAVVIMDRVMEISKLPDLVKQYLQKRQYLHAVVLLNRAILALFEDDLKDIGALKDTHDRLLETRNHLSEDLLEQLDIQLYVSAKPNGLKFHDSAGIDERKTEPDSSSESNTKLSLDIDLSISVSDIDKDLRLLLSEEASERYIRYPQRDCKRYITLLVHALHRLQRLPVARTILLKRIRPALHAIVENETNVLKQEVFLSQRTQTASRQGSSWAHDTITELLRRLFNIFINVLENHLTVFHLLLELDQTPFNNESYGIIRVWFEMQNETWATLLSYLQSSVRVPITTIQQNRIENVESPPSISHTSSFSLNLTFSFTNSSVDSIRLSEPKHLNPGAAPTTAENECSQTWIPILPENILAIYRPVMNFVDQVKALGVIQRKYQGDILRDLLEQYVNTSFVPRVRADANYKVDSIFVGVYAFNVHDGKRTNRTGISVSAVEVADVIDHIMVCLFLLVDV